ncbi:MAG: hypothetical protein ACR2IE_04305 [Candidatus Sumerlaeaceae bacterium]
MPALIVVALLAPPAPAIDTAARRSIPDAGPSRISLRQVAGPYSFGNGLDLNYEIHISPDGQFTYQQASYEGVAAEAAGYARMTGRKLVLTPTSATPEAWPAGMGLELLPVQWGSRLYLVPEKDMMAFVNAVNRGSEPVTQISRGHFFLREGDLDKPASGHPDLPGSFASLLLSKPLRGKVLGEETSGFWKVDLGKRNGLHPGMELCAWSPDRRQCVTLVISRVEDCCCFAENRRGSGAPLLNWKVCSRQQYD